MFSKEVGIDLGTANLLMYVKGEGIVIDEPSVVAIDAETKKCLAAGSEAKEMLGRPLAGCYTRSRVRTESSRISK